MKRFLAVISVLLMLFGIGCENVEIKENSSQTVTSTEDTYERLDQELPDLEISADPSDPAPTPTKQLFTVVTNEAAVFAKNETEPSVINSAIEERNDFLRYKYGAEISARQVKDKDVASELKLAIESGEEYCDLIAISAKETVGLYLSGMLTDLNTLPDFDVSKDYFDKSNSKALATNSSLYLLAEPTAMVYEEAYVYFYNRNLLESAGCENPETLAMQGKWTWDKFLEMSKTAASEVYNKSVADIENDTFAYGAYYNQGTYPLVMWTSTGRKMIDNTYKNAVGLSMSADEIEEVGKKLNTYSNTKGRYALEGNDAQNAFENGRLVFFCNKLEYFYALRDGSGKGSEYGVLPIPKLDENQSSYHCLVGSDARVYSVPKTVEKSSDSHKRFVSLVISASCAAGRDTVKDAFVNSIITLYLNDNNEAMMIETICDSITFDFATVYGSSVREIRRVTTQAICDYIDFGSDISNTIANSKSAFDKYVKNFT